MARPGPIAVHRVTFADILRYNFMLCLYLADVHIEKETIQQTFGQYLSILFTSPDYTEQIPKTQTRL